MNMNSELMTKFWRLWCARKQSEIGYDDPELGVRLLSYKEIENLCDRVEEWESFFDGKLRGSWYQEGDLVFKRSMARIYGKPLSKYYGVVIIEFPLDVVKKTILLGCAPD